MYTIRAFSNNQVLITKVASYGGIITMAGSMVVSIAFPIVMSQLATSAGGWTKTVAIFVIPLTLIGVLRFIFISSSNILSNFMSKIGFAAGSAVTGVMLGFTGYVAGDSVISQPDSALFMIRILYTIVPAIMLVIISVCCKSFTKLEKQIPEWEEKKKAKQEAN